MASKIFIKDKTTRRKIYLAVVLVLAGLSALYNYQSISTSITFKDHLVGISIEETQQKLYNHYKSIFSENQSKLNDLSNNPFFIAAILKADSITVGRLVEEFNSTIQINYKSHIVVEDGSGDVLYGKQFSSNQNISLYPIYENGKVEDFLQLVIYDGDIYRSIVEILPNGVGKIAVLVDDNERFSILEQQSGVQLIPLFNSDLNIDQSRILKSKDNEWVNNRISIFAKEKSYNKRQIVKHKRKFFSFEKIGEFKDSNLKPVGSLYASFDITKYEIPFRKSINRSILITLAILIGSLIVIRLFFNKLLVSIFRLEESFETEIAHQTKEIIDTNIELNQIFNSTANGIRIINNNYEIIRVNHSFTKISGLTREQIEGEKCYNVFPGSFCHTSNCPLERIKEGEKSLESEEVRFNKGGKKVRCAHNAVPFLGKDGELIGIIEDFKDISDKYDVQDTLKRTEEQFSSFMDSLPVGVFIKDNEGVLLYQNTYLNDTFGFDKYLGKNLTKELAQDWATRIKEEDEKTLQLGKIDFEETATDKEGRERTFYTHKFRFLGVDNQWRIGGISIDITSRKKAEHNMYVLSKAVNNSPVCVVITSPQGDIEFTNPAFTRITGYSYSEAMNKNLLSLKVEYNSGKNLVKAFENIKIGEIWRGEVHMQNKNCDHFWVLGSFAPILNRKGEIAHCVATMEDITIRKENEKELLLAKTRAEESDKLKTAFLSNLSHEIRTPLNAIIGFSSLITDSDITFDEKKNLAEVVYKNSNDLLKIIEDLIEISEIETGQLSIKKTECSINKIMNELRITFIEEDKKAKGVKLSLRKEIRSDDFTILTDPLRLKQVLYNLISNACKFTEQGFVEFGYTFKDDKNLLFYVVDSGIGIDPDKQNTIFNPFRQADDSNTRKFGGMGLGLAISKHIVEKLGGRIWFTTSIVSGSTFYFTIPYIPVRLKFEQESVEEIKTNFDWKNKTILIADDIDLNYSFIKAALKNTNAEVIWAKNGKEAVEMVRSNPDISIVLMDIIMPEMDGFEATKKIKQMKSNLPVVCQTAYPSKEHYIASLECGFDTYLAKPIKVQGMLQVIDKYISEN